MLYLFFTCISGQQILDLISNQQDGEKWEDVLARVRHCIGGGSAVEGTDGDLEVVTESVIVNIRCPVSEGLLVAFFSFFFLFDNFFG